MENIKQYIIDFIEGRADVDQFINDCETDPTILDWVQTLVPEGKMLKLIDGHTFENGKFKAIIREVPYTIREEWKSLTMPSHGRTGSKLNVQCLLYEMLKEAFPEEEITFNDYLDKKYGLILNVCPFYICGNQAEALVEKIIDENPKASKKALKEMVRKSFHIEGRKYPRWAQDSDWPFSESGKPMKYISQRNVDSETIELTFEDVDTGKRSTVIDIY